MTIAAAYLTSEGVVLGADSTTTVTSGGKVSQHLNHAQKVFEVGEGSDCTLCTYGAGSVAHVAHRSIAALLGDAMAANPGMTMDQVANELMQLVGKTFQSGSTPLTSVLGYFIGGCEQVSRKARLFVVEFTPLPAAPGTQSVSAAVKELGVGPAFGGSFNYFQRIFGGVDPALAQDLKRELTKQLSSVPTAGVEQAFDAAMASVTPNHTAKGWTDLPIREAIDFVHTYLHITIKVEKFRAKDPVCGGPIEIAFVTTDRRFRWVRHKPFDSAIVEHHNYPMSE